MSNINNFIRSSREKKARMPKYRRHLRRHSVNNLLKSLNGRQNSGRNDEPSYVTQHIHPILGERSFRHVDKKMRNERYRCNVLQKKKDIHKCHIKLQYYTTIIKGYVSDFINNPTEENTNLLIDTLINLKHDTALIFGDEHQTEIVTDVLIYLFNNNQESYHNLEQHPRFNEILIHEHISRQTLYNRFKRTLKKRSPKVGIAPNNRSSRRSRSRRRRSRSRSRSRSRRSRSNSSLNNL